MDNWTTAVDEFIRPWRSRREAAGALVCGSYVTGRASPRSDIDVHIILRAGTPWRERGNQVTRGHMVEYFANPASIIRREYADDHRANTWMAMVSFATGRVLFDYTGEVELLAREAREWLARPFLRFPDDAALDSAKYGLWDTLDNFHDVLECGSPGIAFVFHNAVRHMSEIYSRSTGWHIVPPHQLPQLLTDAEARARYGIPEHPDPVFVELFCAAMAASDSKRMAESIDRLYDHVIQRMGGFEVDGWRSRTPLEHSQGPPKDGDDERRKR